MLIALQQKGIKTSLSSVRRAMRKGNLVKRNRRSPDGLTKADKKAMQPENLLKRDFKASAPDKKWLTDITQVNCKDGKLYIAPVFDCFSGEIVSLAMDTNMKKELCISALEAAFKARKPKTGVIVHSDAGSQYTSYDYKSTIGKYRAIQSERCVLASLNGVFKQKIIKNIFL
jgi:transposase InsO family protein